MSEISLPQAGLHVRIGSRSMGVKLMVVCVLALLMTIPSFFVEALVSDRSERAGNVVQQSSVQAGGQQGVLGSPIRLVDSYRSVTRSLKYVLLFVGLVFLSYFIFEATSGKRVHPAQYVLVGTAQIIFFLLLLSLAEKIGFDWAFLIAGVSTVGLLSANAGWVFTSRVLGMRALATFSLLYVLIYLLLRLEDDALLIGSIASFAAVAAAMYFTRGLDWYSPFSNKEQQSISNTPTN
jgi:inner membrane protein involved in colicin E2 resistance